MRMKNNWPTTVDELVNECEWLSGRYDLYTLGKRDEPFLGEGEPRIDGTDYLAGEYQYGIAMVPAQLVTSILGATVGAGTCHFKVVIDQDPSRRGRGNICECDKCGYRCARGFIDDERFKHCPNCGKRIKEEDE